MISRDPLDFMYMQPEQSPYYQLVKLWRLKGYSVVGTVGMIATVIQCNTGIVYLMVDVLLFFAASAIPFPDLIVMVRIKKTL